MSLRAWRPALRLARRDLRRHRVRAALTFLLVALPVLVAALVAVAVHNGRGTPEVFATEQMGQADALVHVSPWTRVRARDAVLGQVIPAGGRDRQERDPATVDLQALLPPGSRVEPGPGSGGLALATGGIAYTRVVPDVPLARSMERAVAGRLPRTAEEVAVGHSAASTLGLLDDSGAPAADARLDLADGTSLRVVGTLPVSGGTLSAVGRPGVPVGTDEELAATGPAYLVALPEQSRRQLGALSRELAAQGVAMQPRDAVVHPGRWGGWERSLDTESAAAGALAVLVGLVEVVLVVGAAFAVAGRRRLRDLGLVAANGGASRDVRRIVLAQGVVLGVAASVTGAAAGTFLGVAGGRWAERHLGLVQHSSEVPWPAVLAVTVLGALTAVVAALLPAWSLARVAPAQALSGRFPVRLGTVRPHTGSFALAGGGLVVLAAGGYLTSRWFVPRGSENPVGPFVSGLGLLLLLAGVVWATPYLVQVAAAAGRLLPLSGRYAFRAAGRHRFRTAAATTALTFTVAVAVLTGFAVSESVEAATGGSADRHVLVVASGPDRTDRTRVRATVEDTLGPVAFATSRTVGRGGQLLTVRRGGGWPEVRQTDLASLRAARGPLTEAQVAAFRSGELLVGADSGVPQRRDRVRVGVQGEKGRSWTLPVTHLDRRPRSPYDGLGDAFVSADVVERLGLRVSDASYVALADRTITDGDLQRLNAYGIDAWSEDPGRVAAERFRYAGVLGAGLLAVLVVGIAVALSAAEGRDEAATLTAVGAGPARRRGIGAMHGLFLGLAGTALGVLVGLPAALAFVQMDGEAGVDVPWLSFLGTLGAVVALSPVAGWLVTPTRLPLTRRTT